MASAVLLSKSLATPTRIASILDWRAINSCSVMALDLTGNQVGAAVASHPDQNSSIISLEPIRMPTKAVYQGGIDVFERLEGLVKEHKVCAFVVGWPLQPEGRPGKPCGKVLHILDQMVEKSGHSILSKSRPFTLWDDRYTLMNGKEKEGCQICDEEAPDKWGRSISFSRTSIRLGQCNGRPDAKDSSRATEILKQFVGSFWKVSKKIEDPVNKLTVATSNERKQENLLEYDGDGMCISHALL